MYLYLAFASEEGAADYAPAGTGDPYFDHVEYATIKSLVGELLDHYHHLIFEISCFSAHRNTYYRLLWSLLYAFLTR